MLGTPHPPTPKKKKKLKPPNNNELQMRMPIYI